MEAIRGRSDLSLFARMLFFLLAFIFLGRIENRLKIFSKSSLSVSVDDLTKMRHLTRKLIFAKMKKIREFWSWLQKKSSDKVQTKNFFLFSRRDQIFFATICWNNLTWSYFLLLPRILFQLRWLRSVCLFSFLKLDFEICWKSFSLSLNLSLMLLCGFFS